MGLLWVRDDVSAIGVQCEDGKWGSTYDYRLATPAEVLAATHALGYITVKGVTCETCGGTGIVYAYETEDGAAGPSGPCPDCVNGLVPSPEAIEAAATVLWHRFYDGTDDEPLEDEDGHITESARSALLATAGETEEQ